MFVRKLLFHRSLVVFSASANWGPGPSARRTDLLDARWLAQWAAIDLVSWSLDTQNLTLPSVPAYANLPRIATATGWLAHPHGIRITFTDTISVPSRMGKVWYLACDCRPWLLCYIGLSSHTKPSVVITSSVMTVPPTRCLQTTGFKHQVCQREVAIFFF